MNDVTKAGRAVLLSLCAAVAACGASGREGGGDTTGGPASTPPGGDPATTPPGSG